MSSARWTKLNFTKDSQLPLPGEIILLQYPIRTIPFRYRPASALIPSTITSRSYSSFSATASGNPKNVRAVLHHVLVITVSHDPQTHVISLNFMPIMSYSNPPALAAGSTWDADQWMSQASDAERLHHLPVPAAGWTPAPSDSAKAPVLTFSEWVNTRRSWLALILVSYDISEVHQWCRHPDGAVVLDGGANALTNLVIFLNVGIPRRLAEIRTASSATAVNTMMLPNYDTVWADIYGHSGSVPVYFANQHEPLGNDGIDKALVTDDESLTDLEIFKALNGDDGADLVSFWNFPGAPEELRELARQQDRQMLDGRVREWNDCVEDSVDEVVNEDDLDVGDVAFGEEACELE